jgi:glyoxylase-like metal-dependent hydrolase (beta-lactamase superfamily II)
MSSYPITSWQIGRVKITRVIEMEVAGGSRFILPDATRDAVKPIGWLQPHFADDQGNLIMSIHALVIETPEQKIVVDTCIGNDKQRNIPNWSNLKLPFLQDLAEAGYERNDIDTVMCTHLHVDHVGWNTMFEDGQWQPTFPRARYLMGRKEYDYWDSEDDDPMNSGVMGDSVRPVFEAGLVDLVEMDHRICDEVRLEATPGHTPGHVSVHIQSEGSEALITGDCIHHPCQMEKLDWCSSADYDQALARSTRDDLLNRYSDTDVLIIGTHFATPTAGHIKRSNDHYWFDVSQ